MVLFGRGPASPSLPPPPAAAPSLAPAPDCCSKLNSMLNLSASPLPPLPPLSPLSLLVLCEDLKLLDGEPSLLTTERRMFSSTSSSLDPPSIPKKLSNPPAARISAGIFLPDDSG